MIWEELEGVNSTKEKEREMKTKRDMSLTLETLPTSFFNAACHIKNIIITLPSRSNPDCATVQRGLLFIEVLLYFILMCV